MVRFEYEPRNTFLHRRHPLAQLVLVTYLGACAALYWDLAYLSFFVVAGVILALNTKFPRSWFKAVYAMIIARVIGLFLVPTSFTMVSYEFFKVLPRKWVSTTLIEITPYGFPVLGHIALTYGVLYYLVAQVLRFPLFMLSGMCLIYSMNPAALVQVMLQYKVPSSIVLMVMSALRYISVSVRTITNIWNAQTLRGMRIKSRNPITLLRQLLPFLLPVARQFVYTVDQVTISVYARGYGSSSTFNPYKKVKMNWIDYFCILGLPILFVIQLYFLLTPPYYGQI